MYSSSSITTNSSDDYGNKESNLSNNSDWFNKYKYPSRSRLVKSATNSCCSTASDSSNYEIPVERSFVIQKKKRRRPHQPKTLPALGIYWDIENCQVPKNKSPSAVVQRIREVFLQGYRESEFIVVCDIKKENPQVVQELHDSQVILIHVSSLSKNAADEKLRQSLRRFGELYSPPAGVVLISGDINFAADLSDLRYRKKLKVILVHNVNVADALILCANEHHSFTELMKALPPNTPSRQKNLSASPSYLTITNLPQKQDPKRLKHRLRTLTNNCGGKIVAIYPEEGLASVKFTNNDTALRAQRRIQGEDVFGHKITVLSSSIRNFTGRKVKSCDISYQPGGNSGQANHSQESKLSNKQIQNVDSYHHFPDNCMFKPIKDSENGMETGSGLETNWSGSYQLGRRSLTPQELLHAGLNNPSLQLKFGDGVNFTDDGKVIYKSDGDIKSGPFQPVNLIISNLDGSLDLKEIKRQLTNMIEKYAMILSLNITILPDGTPQANVKVNSQQEAQFTISQLHRQKLGHKKIVISYAQNNSLDLEQLKAIFIEILQEAPDKSMPLFKFINLINSRYNVTVSVSDINKLKDVCKISDYSGSRVITLIHELGSLQSNFGKVILPYCTMHSSHGIQNGGWGESNVIQTPNVMISFRHFGAKLNALLEVHGGSMPLLSFQVCYEQEFHQPLPADECGVPLEHLIMCVPNIEIKQVGPNKNIKIIKYSEGKSKGSETEEEAVLKTVPLPLAPNIHLLCRELVELLRTMEKCQLLVSKFIPTYHHHFGRQCRVADYGFTKLLDLFEAIPHVIQIMGDSSRRVITLSHCAQMRRFTSDLLRVLKVQPSKQINLTAFPAAYEKIMNKQFNAVEYGLCTFEDLLQEVPDNIVVISKNDDGIIIAIPKREQTAQEVMRTKQFATEVVDLLRHSPYYSIHFNKFVPAYHHHFGYQCRVSDYGFTKLIELFEAIPDVVKVEDHEDGERVVKLTVQQAIKILGCQITQILKASPQSSLGLEDLPRFYIREYGYPLKPQIYECDTVQEVVSKLSDYIQVVESDAGPLLVAIDVDTMPNVLKIRLWGLLLKPPHCKDLNTMRYEYQTKYKSNFSMDALQQIKNVISISSMNDINFISLTSLYVLAAQLYHVIFKNGGSVLFSNIEKLYYETYGKALKLQSYQINSVDEFYNCFDSMFFIKGSKKKMIVKLNRNLSEHFIPLPYSLTRFEEDSNSEKQETSYWPPLPPKPETPSGAVKKVSPPKPDTPPSPDSQVWYNWNVASANNRSLSLSIQLPIEHNPKLLYDTDTLTSPAKQLIPPIKNVWKSTIPAIWAPHPTELPMPDQLIPKYETMNESTDSGLNVTTSKTETVPSDEETGAFTTAKQLFGQTQNPFSLLNFNH